MNKMENNGQRPVFDMEKINTAIQARRIAEKREWETLSPEEKEKREREKLVAEALNHRSFQLSESMTNAAIESFFGHRFEAERLEATVLLSDRTGISVSIMKLRSMVEHNVIASLIETGNIEHAREVALDPQTGREQHPELFEKAEKWVDSQKPMMGFTEFT
ncbi:MAG: hypothetical protein UX04_C0002G0268 [Microgenomates group bacterium GW2011_GWF2_45_18]|nr:MAG: hypothetical protein UW18_C0003G0294 [Microgenomates group bacterium GW2011_GWF1_44_10]KKU02125.1 MAG: hypothetical protein UX04_C0002G0268 [Microgenomates group bacterium GW2011_GWF2_45_18]